MATIRARKSADGSLRCTVQIRIKKNGMQVYQDSQTFARKQAWAKRRETGLNEPGAIERANRSGTTVASMIEKYLEEYAKAKPIGTTRKATLEAIAKTCLG